MSSNKYTVRHSLSAQFKPKEMASLMENFAKFDTNGDGNIDAEELSVVMKLIGEPCDETTLKTLLKAADADGDGVMSFEEFCQLVQNHKKVIINSFKFHSFFCLKYNIILCTIQCKIIQSKHEIYIEQNRKQIGECNAISRHKTHTF